MMEPMILNQRMLKKLSPGEAEPRPLERETEVIGEEHPTDLQEHTENDADQKDQLKEQRDKSQESTLESENQEYPDSSKPKVPSLPSHLINKKYGICMKKIWIA